MRILLILLIMLFFSACDLFIPSFTVTYDPNGSTLGSSAPVDNGRYKVGAIVTVMGAGGLWREQYSFTGWNTKADGSGTDFSAFSTFVMGSENVTLYANWKTQSIYSVIYDGNGSSGGSPPVDINAYSNNQTVTILGNSGLLTRANNIFRGWNTRPDKKGASYYEGDTFNIDSSSVRLYALWEPVSTFAPLDDGFPVDISEFNNTHIYSIVNVMPGKTAQGNYAPVTQYSYTLSTSSTLQENVKSLSLISRNTGKQSSSVYMEGQIKSDQLMHTKEEELLRRGIQQISKIGKKSINGAPSAISIGTTWNNVNIVITGTIINTTCRYISDYAYFFVDNRDISEMDTYFNEHGGSFDSIYMMNHIKFGNENDVDGNGRIIIIFSQELSDGLLGYFYSGDKYSKSSINDSNEGDIIYITADKNTGQAEIVGGALAHEFQHMIYFDQHANRNVTETYVWLTEALSQAAEYYNGYFNIHLSHIESFLLAAWPELSLTYWTSKNYGFGAIFIRYLIDQFGDEAIKNMCSTEKVGIEAVESATGIDFNITFNNFIRALAMLNTGDSIGTKYFFNSLDVLSNQLGSLDALLTPNSEYTSGQVDSSQIYPYGFSFNSWQGSFGSMTLTGSMLAGTAFGLSM